MRIIKEVQDMKFMMIKRVCNSWGIGYVIEADGCEGCAYYGYSKREAIRKYRESNGLVGKHFDKIEF